MPSSQQTDQAYSTASGACTGLCLSTRLDFIINTDASDKTLTRQLWMTETRWSNVRRWRWYRLLSGVCTTACWWTQCWWRFLLVSLLLRFQSCWV